MGGRRGVKDRQQSLLDTARPGLVMLEYKNTRTHTKASTARHGQRSDMQTYAEVSTFMDNLSL